MKVLLTGGSGQVGRELALRLQGRVNLWAPASGDFNLASPDSWHRQMVDFSPDVIINAAAYTAVEQAEADAATAMAVNGVAPGIMAGEAKRLGALLVHYSTDYVFDGRLQRPYTESDPTGPLSVYGRTKRAGELAIEAGGSRHLILRTSWVYGAHGRNFFLTMKRLMRERAEVRVVNDQWGVPNPAAMLAEQTLRAVEAVLKNPELSGLYHLSLTGKTSWFGFAEAIARAYALPCRIIPVSSDEYPSKVIRPANSVLDSTRFAKSFGVVLPDWSKGLESVSAMSPIA